MTGLEESLREFIKDEIRRLVRPDALVDTATAADELALHQRAYDAAARLRRARS